MAVVVKDKQVSVIWGDQTYLKYFQAVEQAN